MNNDALPFFQRPSKFDPIPDCKQRLILGVIACDDAPSTALVRDRKWFIVRCIIACAILDKPHSTGNADYASGSISFMTVQGRIFFQTS